MAFRRIHLLVVAIAGVLILGGAVGVAAGPLPTAGVDSSGQRAVTLRFEAPASDPTPIPLSDSSDPDGDGETPDDDDDDSKSTLKRFSLNPPPVGRAQRHELFEVPPSQPHADPLTPPPRA